MIRLEGVWLKTDNQVTFLFKIQIQLEDSLQSYQEACLAQLQIKLQAAVAHIGNLTGSPIDGSSASFWLPVEVKPLKKLKYSACEKGLQKVIDELEAWQRRFDPSWFLTIRIASSSIDQSLQEQSKSGSTYISTLQAIRNAVQSSSVSKTDTSSIFCDPGNLAQDRIQLIDSQSCLTEVLETQSGVILDTTAFPKGTDMLIATTHVRDLASLLATSDPSTLGLLKCLGVLKNYDSSAKLTQFQFIFDLPMDCGNPSSLRFMLRQTSPSLDAKFMLAKCLARSVMAVHSASFVHKNIRPESIIVFEKGNGRLPAAFLTGFERFRPAAAGTILVGDMNWERNLYRHPKRQGILPEDTYIMQHDIYSLGVCLLEIGLWTSFVLTSESPEPGQMLHISPQLEMKNQKRAAVEIKQILSAMAKEQLPSRMGSTYTEVVMSCLTCLDPGEANMFANEDDIYDKDGIIVGVAFIEKILVRIEGISIS